MKGILSLLTGFIFLFNGLNAQVCGTPGKDGPAKIFTGMNTYFPISGEVVLTPGSRQVQLSALPENDPYGTGYGIVPIAAGDLLMLIQTQDAAINYEDNANYGSGNPASGPDGLGGTGVLDIAGSGKYEYVIATNAVPLTGGLLTFSAAGSAQGVINTYVNAAATNTHGARRFQVIRVPQYSNLTLEDNIIAPAYNGRAGGILVFNVAATMDFNGFTIDASARGFRGGYGDSSTFTGDEITTYVMRSTDVLNLSTGKGEGIAGTPRYLWDGLKLIDNGQEGLPGGSYGRGAAGNAGGGGNNHNAGGGGGGNGGAGGSGGFGPGRAALRPLTSGRPGAALYAPSDPNTGLLFMGGGGGSGHANPSLPKTRNVEAGPGGGIIVIKAGTITGTGIMLSNGNNGGVSTSGSDGGGGGGAGGTVLVLVSNPDPSARLKIAANGGNGGDSASHGPGGGGGGGQVFSTLPASTIEVKVNPGIAGKNSQSMPWAPGQKDGQTGNYIPLVPESACLPVLTTSLSALNSADQYPGIQVSYMVHIRSANAGVSDALLDLQLPPGFSFVSAQAVYSGGSAGPPALTNLGTNAGRPLLGGFYIPQEAEVTLTVIAKIDCNTPGGTYHASAQTAYPDPTRTDSLRMITPAQDAFTAGTSYQTSYEFVPFATVPGTNYNGNPVSADAEDVTVQTVVIRANQIHIPAATGPFCFSADPETIIGEEAVVGEGTFTYQWEQSADGISYTSVAGATDRDFDPPLLTATTWFRRQVVQHGCSVTKDVSAAVKYVIYPPVQVDFKLPAICESDGNAVLTNQTQNADGTTDDLAYEWDFGDAVNATAANPNTSAARDGAHVYTQAGNYTVTLKVIKGGICPQQAVVKTLLVSSVPQADFTFQPGSYCSGQSLVFQDASGMGYGEITRIKWHYDDADPAAVETDDTPAKRTEPPKTYTHLYPIFRTPATRTVKVRMEAYSGNSCVNAKEKEVILYAVPEVDFSEVTPICRDAAPVQLNQGKEIHGVVSGNGVYSGKGVSASGLFDPAKADTGPNVLTYTFTSTNGCMDSRSQTVEVLAVPTANAGKDQVVLEGGSVQLEGTATGPVGSILAYKWTPATGLDRDDVLNPLASPLRDITYRLTVVTDRGCDAYDDVEVKVLRNPEVPTAFSPNGDGVNDYWNVRYLGSYPKATIAIYNRYGERVFSSTANSKSWDGKYNGKEVPAGVYYYIVDPQNGRKRISGSITVLR